MRYPCFNKTTFLALALLLAPEMASADNISGTISSTLTINSNSQLTGDVTCTTTGSPCIAFGAPNLQLNLNGHIITGTNGALDHCTGTTGGGAINTNSQNGAIIQGPGIITMFQGLSAIRVLGNNSTVSKVVITGTCGNGIYVQGSNNVISSNSISRFSLSGAFSIGAANNGIVVGCSGPGTFSNTISGNQITGAGSLVLATPGPNPVYSTGPGYGILVSQNCNGNTISGNSTSGNALGIFVWGTGNTVSGNEALGNTALGDIYDPNAPGANTYTNNLCQLSGQVVDPVNSPGAPACPGKIPAKLIGN